MSVFDAGKITLKAEAAGKTPIEYVLDVYNRQAKPHQVKDTARELGVHVNAVYAWLHKAKQAEREQQAGG